MNSAAPAPDYAGTPNAGPRDQLTTLGRLDADALNTL